MARHLTIGTVIDKNKISSDESFVILIDAAIKDDDGNPVTTISFCKNSEQIIYRGVTYLPASFDISLTSDANSEPTIKLNANDYTRQLSQYVEAFSGLVNSNVTMTVINTASISSPPEIQEVFKVIGASVNEYIVELDLGTESAVSKRFPAYRQFRDRCPWKYKGSRCGYTGSMPTCDFSLYGSNGCIAHGNVQHFGGFPALGDG